MYLERDGSTLLSKAASVAHFARALLACSAFLCLCACEGSLSNEQQPCSAGEIRRIGVLWPGPVGAGSVGGWRKTLDWALENVNAYAERTGFCLQTLMREVNDTDPENLKAVAKDLAEDDAIQAVIGPTTSSQVIDVAGVFLKAKKPFVAPTATAGELARVIENEPQRAKFVWRTVGSDVMRARAAAAWIAAQGWSRVALVAARESKAVSVAPLRTLRTGGYGDTYADWMGIFAEVSSIHLTSLQRADTPFSRQVCRTLVRPQAALLQEHSMKKVATHRKSLQGELHDADVLVVAASSSQDIACVVQAAREIDSRIPVLVTESMDFCLSNPSLCYSRESGNHLYTITPTALPDSGFLESYRQRFGEEPPAYAAQVYDAVLWIFYSLVREPLRGFAPTLSFNTNASGSGPQETTTDTNALNFKGSENRNSVSGKVPFLARAMQENARRQRRVTSTPVHWGKAGIGRAIQALQTGRSVRLGGAGGALAFDPDLDIDPTMASYRLERVAGDTAVPLDVLTVRIADDGNFAVKSHSTRSSNDGFTGNTRCSEPTTLVNEDTRVLLLASSYGWRNYRHQSDLLAVRDWLVTQGVQEKHMITIAADDLAEHSKNPDTGSVINRSSGVNLHQVDRINYRLCGDDASCPNGVTVSDVLRVLAGDAVKDKCLREPCAVSGVQDGHDLIIYLTGHAGAGGLYLNHATALEPLQGSLRPEKLADILQSVSARRVFLAVDTCHAGVFGEEIARRALPNVVVFSATRREEVSFSEFFDPRLRTPLGNQFTARWLDVLRRTPAVPLPSMAWQVARGTLGSHVELYNALHFADLGCARLARPSF